MLTVRSFRKAFGEYLILDIPELSFAPGIHWVKGKNGSGKSTLFNCLAGLSPFNGEVVLNDISLSKSPQAFKILLNYSQSEPTFPEFLTGSELIEYFAKLKKAAPQQVKALKENLGVESYADQPCGTYSSGMMKKLSLVIAFLGNPDWIILDEPLITLDKEAQDLVAQLISKESQTGTSFIFATHQDFENTRIKADRVYEVSNRTISLLA
ncbi:ABC transporter ATP-binding protein [Roseivirga sp.]|uniref:ABC transporter ATP-binding protein n=1 Tax=Roseivirga sp. TaxID=1964215 RepID=UPI003B8ADC2B